MAEGEVPEWHKVGRCGLETEEMETEGDRQRDIWRERRRCVVVGGGLESIRNSETLWIY